MVKPLIGSGGQKLERSISNLPILKRSVDLNIHFFKKKNALWDILSIVCD
jgi:hypothetical protein